METKPVAIVTGGSRGIGRGICLELARRGYAVTINYAGNEAAARETQSQVETRNPTRSLLCQGDVAVAADRERLIARTLETWGRIDLLVNNAGITSVGRRDVLEATEESWDRVLGVNLKGPYFLTQRVAQEMIRLLKREELVHPCIINITSLSTYAVSTNRGDYCISKAGMSMLTRVWAVRLADHGIRVFEVRPGVIETDMTAGAREKYDQLIAEGLTPIRRWGTPEDVGRAVAALASADFPFSTGDAFSVDGGFHIRRL
jgi:NAD(P)-dependent dehydrogenase (short-subunit alcohol dehydrogenase family)